MATATADATGKVIQITGPVVDIEFPPGSLPAIFNAVEIEREGQDPLVCEVQQHLGNNWVRAVAMTTTDGLARGVARARHRRRRSPCRWARSTLGRVFNVLGHAHRREGRRERGEDAADPPRAAALRGPATEIEVFETGLKVIDLIARSRRAARSASSAAPASARRSSSRS